MYFNWVYLQHITWYEVLLAVPHFKLETNTRAPLCPALCVLQKEEDRNSPSKQPNPTGLTNKSTTTVSSQQVNSESFLVLSAVTLTMRCSVDRACWKQASSLSIPAPFKWSPSFANNTFPGSQPERKLLYDRINTQEPPDLAHHFSRAKFSPNT